MENKGWKRFTLDFNLANSTEIISYEHGSYTLLEYYDSVDENRLNAIKNKVQRMLEEQAVANVRTFFNNNQMYIKSIGIETPYVLYAILKEQPLDGVDGIRFPRFPYIITGQFERDSLAAQYLVEDFIREENRIVAREEVLHWLKEKVGSGARVLDNALVKSDDILYYSEGQYGIRSPGNHWLNTGSGTANHGKYEKTVRRSNRHGRTALCASF